MAGTHRAPGARPRRSVYQEWTPDRAEAIAASLGLRLGAMHWRVIGCARELWSSTRRAIDLEALAERVELPLSKMSVLFREPLAARLRAIAGIEE